MQANEVHRCHPAVWRTSTPEPTRGDGIIWTYLKDATRFIPLFAKPGTFILQLDNLLETGLDGQYASTCTAIPSGTPYNLSVRTRSHAARDILCLFREAPASAEGRSHHTCQHTRQ